MSLESALEMYFAQEPCAVCGSACNGKYCSEQCAKVGQTDEDDYEIDERR